MAIKLNQGLNLKQTQSLMMTPQLQQAIKLLTLNHMEMTELITQEMSENPMLEEGEEQRSNQDIKDKDYQIENLEMQNKEAKSDDFNEGPIVNKDDFDWTSYVESYNSSSSTLPTTRVKVSAEELPNYENMVSKGQSLADHLEWQIRMENLVEAELELALEIIHNLSSSGYLEVDFEGLIENSSLERDDALELLKMVQRLDPIGCATRNLKECLLVQAQMLTPRSVLVEKIINDHLELIGQKKYDEIEKILGVDRAQILWAHDMIREFHPRPGRLVSSDDTHYVVPDIQVKEVGGKFVVHLNDEGVPRLRISQLYQQLLKSGENIEADAKEFVNEKLKSAVWLIKSIQNRQRTIMKVSHAIVERQQEFFKKGPKFLKPMVLKDIAQEIEMHESTVSRVTTNKFMHTPIGVFELKYFFNAGIGGKNGGDEISGEVLKIKIKSFIEKEDPKRPLSDQKLVTLLESENIKVARRTVAKYREILGILSSAKRKVK